MDDSRGVVDSRGTYPEKKEQFIVALSARLEDLLKPFQAVILTQIETSSIAAAETAAATAEEVQQLRAELERYHAQVSAQLAVLASQARNVRASGGAPAPAAGGAGAAGAADAPWGAADALLGAGGVPPTPAPLSETLLVNPLSRGTGRGTGRAVGAARKKGKGGGAAAAAAGEPREPRSAKFPNIRNYFKGNAEVFGAILGGFAADLRAGGDGAAADAFDEYILDEEAAAAAKRKQPKAPPELAKARVDHVFNWIKAGPDVRPDLAAESLHARLEGHHTAAKAHQAGAAELLTEDTAGDPAEDAAE